MHDLRCAGLLVRALARLEPGRGWRELLRSTEAKLGAVHVPPGEVLLFAWDGAVGIAAAWLARSDAKRALETIGSIVDVCTERSWPEAVVDASLVQATALAALETEKARSRRRAGPTSGPAGTASASTPGAPRPLSPRSSRTAPLPNRRRRARRSAATLLDSVTDASVREELQTEIQRVLDEEGSAWA